MALLNRLCYIKGVEIIVGAGIAGLTSAAFLSKHGCRVLLI